MAPKVSICIPVYNVEKYIARCLDSVVNQTLRDIEIIVVNDATPDNSMEIVRRYAEEDSRIRIIENEHNRGLMATRRVGYMAATGDWLTFVDSDDWLPENAVELLYRKAMETGADLVSGAFQRVDGHGKYGAIFKGEMTFGNDRLGLFKAIVNYNIAHCLWSKLYRRSIWQEFDYIVFENCTLSEDLGAFFQYIDHCNSWALADSVVYYYFTNSESLMHNVTLHAFECNCKNIKICDDIMRKYRELDEDRERYFTKCCSRASLHLSYYKLLKKYGMHRYVSLECVCRHFIVVVIGRIKRLLQMIPV